MVLTWVGVQPLGCGNRRGGSPAHAEAWTPAEKTCARSMDGEGVGVQPSGCGNGRRGSHAHAEAWTPAEKTRARRMDGEGVGVQPSGCGNGRRGSPTHAEAWTPAEKNHGLPWSDSRHQPVGYKSDQGPPPRAGSDHFNQDEAGFGHI